MGGFGSGAVMPRNQADTQAHRKAPDPRDLFQLIDRAVDEAAEASGRRGVSVSTRIDPALRVPREIDPAHLLETVRKLAGTALADGQGHSICLQAESEGDLVRLTATAGSDRTWAVTLSAPLARRKVLVIDDDPTARVELAAALEAEGFACRTATGAETALHALFAGGPWAAVLIELYLESGDALELAGVADAPVFAMSAADRQISGWALRQAGFHGLFAKPVPIAKLKAALAASAPQSSS
ncbi:response regulator [Caulobacter mirabilis]|uniref:Response regulatory domain-containing protein n=1 Tax=Caulobacter mirabilis TaxID=69666 RepID=A0A2D2B1E8_9CAUL|nr:response regulator [Caulobacter mirabilis]ATQ44080.1 hypothetical protein CSW64_17635 [Caulobacter mirabilis]